MAGYGYGAKEARYNTRLAKQTHEQVNLCGSCGRELPATELLCKDCRGTLNTDSGDLFREAFGGLRHLRPLEIPAKA